MKLAALVSTLTLATAGTPLIAGPAPCPVITEFLGEYNSPGSANQVQVVGTTAYVVDWFPNESLQIIDVTDPSDPLFLGSLSIATSPIGFAVDGTTVYLPGSAAGLRVIDASDPSAPEQVGFFGALGAARDIVVRDGVGYLALTSSLRTIDVRNPSNPIQIGSTVRLDASVEFVAVVGDYAYTTDFIDGIMQIFDISDPTTIESVGTYSGFDFVTDIDAVGTMVYVTDMLGLHILDASDPAAPTLVSFTPSGNAKGISVLGNTAYIAGGPGLVIYDVSDPSAPDQIGSYTTAQPSRGISVLGDTAYLADDSFGLQIVGLTDDCSDCPADFTGDGTLDIFDVFAFLDAFNASDPAADFTGDGEFDIFDIFDYLSAFNAGCP